MNARRVPPGTDVSGDATPVTIARIDQLALWTADPGRLADFYAEHLGALASPLCVDEETGLRFRFLDFCGVGLELVGLPAGADPRPGERERRWRARIAFALGSAVAVDELTARLAAAGHAVLETPRRERDGCYRSVVLDPDGNPIALTV
jgi:lactoylglutathione lyase